MSEMSSKDPDDSWARRTASTHPGTGRFDLGLCVSEAWMMTWRDFPRWIGMMLVASVVSVLAMVTVVGAFLVVPVVAFGYVAYLLRAYTDESEVGDLFCGFKTYGFALVQFLWLGLVYGALGVAAGSMQFVGEQMEVLSLQLLGGLAYVVIATFLLPRFQFAPFFVVDQNMPALDAVRTSWEITADQKTPVVLLGGLSGILPLLGLLVLGIGFFPATMMASFLWVSAYRQLGRSSEPS
jgi:hypothetical protein